MKKFKILVINGANLNMLGVREPEIYGDKSYLDLVKTIKDYSKKLKIGVKIVQTNSESKIIEYVQRAYKRYDGIIINAGGYSHTSIAIADAIKSVNVKAVEVHISDIENREEFRKFTYLKDVCVATIKGLGFNGYLKAIDILLGKENESNI